MTPSTGVSVRPAGPRDAAEVHTVVRAAFADRPRLDPPADALAETEASLAAALAAGGGLLAELDGRPVGSLLLDQRGDSLYLRRFGVVPAAQGRGVAGALVAAALAVGTADDRIAEVAVLAREELPASVAFWEAHGFRTAAREAPYLRLVRPTRPLYDVPDAEAMRALGRELAAVLDAGDLLVLTGGLGAGKTTFTQGLAAGLGVRGEVTSPTFVIARVHPGLDGGPALVHADAYRLGGVAELDDLDLDATLEDAVTVVEWGAGLAEGLAEDRLEVRITRASEAGLGDLDPRRVMLVPAGARWARTAWPPTRWPPTGSPPTGIVSHETQALDARGDAFRG
jgi:tRNA threonylcarbamoyladenosine biosynthesis protein TsaE